MKVMIFAAALAAFALGAPAATAQSACGPYEPTAQHLVDKYGEQKLMELGTIPYKRNGFTHAELWLNIETGTYTYLFVNSDNGYTCIGDSGDAVRFSDPSETPEKSADVEPEGDPA